MFPNSPLSSGKEGEIKWGEGRVAIECEGRVAIECEGRDADGPPAKPEGSDCTESVCTVDSAGTMMSGINCMDGPAISVCVDD